MGTPATFIIKNDSKILLNKFFHFDGYFSYTGIQIINFIRRNNGNIEQLISKNCNFITEEEANKIYKKYMIEIQGTGLYAHKPGLNLEIDYPGLSERTSTEDFLNLLEYGPRFDFCSDNIDCSYVYTIDLSDNTFEYADIKIPIQEIIKQDFDLSIFDI